MNQREKAPLTSTKNATSTDFKGILEEDDYHNGLVQQNNYY